MASADWAQLSCIDFSWLKGVGVSKMELASSLDRRVAALVCTAGMNQGGVPQSLPFASSGGLSCSLGLAWKELGGVLMASQDNDVFLLELLF